MSNNKEASDSRNRMQQQNSDRGQKYRSSQVSRTENETVNRKLNNRQKNEGCNDGTESPR